MSLNAGKIPSSVTLNFDISRGLALLVPFSFTGCQPQTVLSSRSEFWLSLLIRGELFTAVKLFANTGLNYRAQFEVLLMNLPRFMA